MLKGLVGLGLMLGLLVGSANAAVVTIYNGTDQKHSFSYNEREGLKCVSKEVTLRAFRHKKLDTGGCKPKITRGVTRIEWLGALEGICVGAQAVYLVNHGKSRFLQTAEGTCGSAD